VADPLASLAVAVAGLREELKAMHLARHANTANVSVNAGGIGVWVASTCAAVAMTLCLAMGGVILNQQREIGELRQYLAAIYMQVPHLKPEGSE
jgi:hypothetical protein